jgi:catechol 2,3-dioxygenase-like lactoylglutathione lyase family enzyme
MKFTGICLITRDVPRLADFYSRVLGVEFFASDPNIVR